MKAYKIGRVVVVKIGRLSMWVKLPHHNWYTGKIEWFEFRLYTRSY